MAETGATVPLVPPYLTRTGVVTAAPVRGPQWIAAALATNHLLGRGRVLIPHSFCNTALTKSSTRTLRFKTWPSLHARLRRWTLSVKRPILTTTPHTITFNDPSGGAHVLIAEPGAAGDILLFSIAETISSPSGSETELVVTFDAGTGDSHTLTWISCSEHPRPDLDPATESGVVVDRLNPNRIIDLGPAEVLAGVDDAVDIAQRSGLFQFARAEADYLSTTSAGYTPVFLSGAVPVVLGRSLYVGDTLRTVQVRARCSSGAGTTGNLRFTMASGDTLVLAITSAMASSWLSGTLDVKAEDLSTSDGRRGGADDTCLIEWQRTGGASSVSLESISIGNG